MNSVAMLKFHSVNVPKQLERSWNKLYCTTECILAENPSIIKYWVYVRRDSLYRRLRHFKISNVEHIWTKLLSQSNNISPNDINEIYEYIRTQVDIVITDIYCTSSYYAQIKQNEDERKSITITLSGRLFTSDQHSFLFVASAVLLRELTRAIYPKCLINKANKKYIRNPLFFSWTGIPLYLWPYYLRKRERDSFTIVKPFYRTYPCDGHRSLVCDVGNLFQHIFYNGEVHLYDEFDERCEQVVTDAVIKVHDSVSALCSARYLNDEFFDNFFNVHQYSLETVRVIEDQKCPYYSYRSPLNGHYFYYFFLIVNDTPATQRWCSCCKKYLECRGPCYQYKPYHFYEPRQFYEQTYFSGHPLSELLKKCCRLKFQVIPTNDAFFVENRSLFRHSVSFPGHRGCGDEEIKNERFVIHAPRYDNNDLDDESLQTTKSELICIFAWRWCLSRIRKLYSANKNTTILL